MQLGALVLHANDNILWQLLFVNMHFFHSFTQRLDWIGFWDPVQIDMKNSRVAIEVNRTEQEFIFYCYLPSMRIQRH